MTRTGDCVDLPAEWWDTDAPKDLQAEAMDVCRTCPVRVACRKEARSKRNRISGIWAGVMYGKGAKDEEESETSETSGESAKSGKFAKFDSSKCGSWAGYQRHRKAGQSACTECLRAAREYRAGRPTGIPRQRRPLDSYLDESAIQRRMDGNKAISLTTAEAIELVRRWQYTGRPLAECARVTGLRPHRYIEASA